MILKNIQYAIRNLTRDKFYTFLNGVGLAIGMAAALLIFLWANDELSFDNFHSKGNRIHRVLCTWTFGGEEENSACVPIPLAEAARAEIPEIENFVLMWNAWNAIVKHGEKRIELNNAYLVDDDFFEVFDFPFIEGNAATAFATLNSAVLTKSTAERIFGTADVIGQPLKLSDKMDLTVSAIMADVPSNSHIQFEMLVPFTGNYSKFMGAGSTHWGAFNFTGYTLLRPGIDVEAVDKKLTALIPNQEDDEDKTSFNLQALSDVYLGSGWMTWSIAPRGDLGSIKLVGIIGLLILLIACVNYVNMNTARSSHRAKSTGVKKVIGATRWQLFSQYLIEASILVGVSSLVAIALANMSLGIFEELSGKQFADGQLWTQSTVLIVAGTALMTILLAGIQPAFQLSSFKPLQTLRGSTFNGKGRKGGMRKVLVTSQFVCSGALIIGTLVMLAQMDFLKSQKLGYNREEIFSFRCDDADPLMLKNQLKGTPGVVEVTTSDQSIVNVMGRYGGFDYEGKEASADPYFWQLLVDEDFPEFFGLELAEGRWFLPGNRDTAAFILNETAARSFGLTDPIGKWFKHNGVRGTIVGVAKDFHFRSLHHEIEPLVFTQRPEWMSRVFIKTTGEGAANAIATAEKIFRDHEPNAIFEYAFLDESYDNLYKTESRTGSLFAIFSALAIFISCLGVFGLAAYTAERRTKEIGIRKVLGASVISLVGMLSRDFVQIVILALFIAAPIAWYFMENWLADFEFRIQISGWIFVVASLIAVGIALLTVSFHSIRAALANPVESLKSE